jgi:hypothetical protein
VNLSTQHIAVGVIVERRQTTSPWAEFVWRPVAVLAGVPDTPTWTRLAEDGDAATFYAGPTEITLHRSEADDYRRNLVSGTPAIWVMLNPTGGEPPYVIGGATADPAEGEAWTESGQAIVEPVPMPDALRELIGAFASRFPGRPAFVKRQRNRADPEALARRVPLIGRRDERR